MEATQEYFEILIEPHCHYEGFLAFITGEIEPCIEELCTPHHLSSQSESISSLDLGGFFQEGEGYFRQILIRSTRPPQDILPKLQAFCAHLAGFLGEEVGFGFGYRICQNKDWMEAYKQSILPVEVAGFYIRPSWHLPSPKTQLKDMVIDPALAFGSGHHASTSMCLELLDPMDLRGSRLLDVGCGSGILGIGARMLGAEVDLCDTDPLALEESEKNFALNHCDFSRSWLGSVSLAEGQYDLIIANILAHVLLMLKGDFDRKLKVQGTLILSGILSDYKSQILEGFGDYELLELCEKDEWIALKLGKFE